MLQRVGNVRVFESSEDVIIPRSSHRHHSPLNGNSNRHLHAHDDSDDNEDEQLHPHHPFRMQKRVLERESVNHVAHGGNQEPIPVNKQVNRSMELVYLASGEIRARKDCPPSLDLPPLQLQDHVHSEKDKLRLKYETFEERDKENTVRDTRYSSVETCKPPRNTQRRHEKRQISSPLSSSFHSMSPVDEKDDVSSDDDDEFVPLKKYDEKKLQQEKQKVEKPRKPRNDETTQTREKKQSQSLYTHSNHRPAQLETTSLTIALDRPSDDLRRLKKRSPKMEVAHLVSEALPQDEKAISESNQREETKLERLEKELQKEKKRVFKLTTHLLEEEKKNQQLGVRLDALEAQLAAKDKEMQSILNQATRKQKEEQHSIEKEHGDCVSALQEKLCRQEDEIARLTQDNSQLTTTIEQLKERERTVASEMARLKADLDDRDRCLYAFLTKLTRWKTKSKETMQHCDKSQLPALVKEMWLEYPHFPDGVANAPINEANARQSLVEIHERPDMVHELQKEVSQLENKLQETHQKYLELKEMCARNHVREADLQNFINGHRLRGNLVLSQPSDNGGKNQQAMLRSTDEIPSENSSFSDENQRRLRTPKVFVQLDDNQVYEYASPIGTHSKRQQQEQRVERIQLVSSTQRRKQATPRSDLPSSSFRSHAIDCPPRCGSRPSTMRQKTTTGGTTGRRNRPVTTASKGRTGVIRPWM